MKTLLVAVAVVAAIILCAAIVFFAYGREKTWMRLAGSPDRGRLDLVEIRRSPTANDALACTARLRDDCDFEVPAIDAAPADIAARLAGRIEDADPLARRVDDGDDPAHLRYVTYSPAMRFPDLISIELVPLDDGRTGVIAYARAQLGRLDFGANLERLKLYLKDL
ncbi:DUF1499 domain-containing protein [Hoeflea poritis]|uniref:DUF1499 domain-containing protein n=1 Tax=Hoeflea poritis TaxID=2993659 RepID=A0ABT4VRH5_9HYPH|nr:DUF1499 domain-containing protein [Hoeflea poritis]MDA4847303.1 DUF1499 domain-containing protein [Hoeflea poritis]